MSPVVSTAAETLCEIWSGVRRAEDVVQANIATISWINSTAVSSKLMFLFLAIVIPPN